MNGPISESKATYFSALAFGVGCFHFQDTRINTSDEANDYEERLKRYLEGYENISEIRFQPITSLRGGWEHECAEPPPYLNLRDSPRGHQIGVLVSIYEYQRSFIKLCALGARRAWRKHFVFPFYTQAIYQLRSCGPKVGSVKTQVI